jgi:1-aminocyclopropane-1-carboxylate deaminase
MEKIKLQNITIDKIQWPAFPENETEVFVMRLDKIHPVISGNKWFKLRFYLEEAKQQNKKTIVTFGGAYSNHIVATAAACAWNGLKSIGIIRGEKTEILSPTLMQAQQWGMQFHFLNRTSYKEKHVPYHLQNNTCYVINEGGFGEKGMEGAATILDQCNRSGFSHYCCAVGTGTMLAGMAMASLPDQQVTGISVMKNNFELEDHTRSLLNGSQDFRLIHDYHFGGYAKYTPELIRFMNAFYLQTQIPSDFVYTGKLFFAVTDLVLKKYFPAGSKILVIHSGGLQGNASLRKGTLIF